MVVFCLLRMQHPHGQPPEAVMAPGANIGINQARKLGPDAKEISSCWEIPKFSSAQAGWLQFEPGAHAHIMAQHSADEMQIILYRALASSNETQTSTTQSC